ncbi:CDP-glycerol glycerophosphotransferase family protein [Pseudalkalibacillus berkeleyi]|uniref:CDP-glycerol glycerophosphotransferase family protein n=1 Tax=Pseudalkalibacillus berkeleyi TaxID=1069813 RepID=A0ABS9H196_9BACL|nr:CDP-glycerol glycerophosphotransferase family protein [Pseudalkalibacillus berkeleyi]MCF6138778.1 CDP-glycerol glycerophosphotransferase family protein [Pseudalkalibacillus berkeleyi]
MAREFAIWLYLEFFKAIFRVCNLFPLKENKVTFVVSFSQNPEYIYEEMKRQHIQYKSVFICTKRTFPYFQKRYPEIDLYEFESANPIEAIKSIYHIATSKFIIIDNYYGFLSVTEFKQGVKCIQLWHAAGALKKFALQDRTISHRSKNAKLRFEKVYSKFDKVVVGSDALTEVYKEAFNLKDDKVLKTGIPRTDFFYDTHQKNRMVQKIYAENPKLKNKKVILYAPTFRDNHLDDYHIKLDIKRMQKELGDEYVLIVRLHPAVNQVEEFGNMFSDFVYDYSAHPNVNELLLITDVLITDYSSIPFEFSLLEKPMIFFPYDLKEYEGERGVWSGYGQMVPGPIVFSTHEIISLIKDEQFDLELVRAFSEKWNSYSRGESSKKFVNQIFS